MYRWTLALGLLLLLVGCGDRRNRLAVVPVRGRVFEKAADGKLKPMGGAKLVFVPVVDPDAFPSFPGARTEADGTYQLGTYEVADGAPAGDYIVTVEWKDRRKPDRDVMGRGEVERGPDKLKGLYSHGSRSPLRATVIAGQDLVIHVPAP